MKREDVITKHFSRAFMGYDMLEVDAFLDDVIRHIERLENALADAEVRNKVLSEELEYKIKFEGYVKKDAGAEASRSDSFEGESAVSPENKPVVAEEQAPAANEQATAKAPATKAEAGESLEADDYLREIVESVVDEELSKKKR